MKKDLVVFVITMPELVFYKLPGCPHCIAVEPEWAKAKAASRGLPFRLVEVTADAMTEAEQALVQSFPTFGWRVDGKLIDTFPGGDRRSGTLLAWAKAHGPAGGRRSRARVVRGKSKKRYHAVSRRRRSRKD